MTMSSRTDRERQLGDQRDAHARRDQALDGLVVVALERHAGLEAGGVAAAHDLPRARARARGLHPRFAAQVLQAQRCACCASRCSRGSARCRGSSSSATRDSPAAAASPGTRTAARGRARRRAGAARSPRARPRRGSARRRDRRRGSAAIASGISVAPAVGKEATRRRPPRRPAIAAERRLGGLQAREDPLGVADQRLTGRGQA